MASPKDEIIEKVTALALPLTASMGLELVDVEYRRTGRDATLSLFIDKNGGVTLDDCAEFSGEFSLLLDIEDIIPCEYTLETSSPGLDRPIKRVEDYTRFTGKLARIRTYEPFQDGGGNRRKTFLGILEGIENGMVLMKLKEGQIASIPLEKIARANLEFEFQ